MPTRDQPARSTLVDAFPALKRLGRIGAPSRIPVVRQLAEAECGAACLAMILAFYGKVVRIDDLRATLGGDREGTTALAILNVARQYGLRGRGVRVEIEDLPYLQPGCILHWDFSHFVVLERVGAGGAHIIDPASGRRSVTTSELRRSFTGAALELEPGDTFEPMVASRKPAWRYLQDVLSESGLWVRISVISVLLQFFALALPILTGALVDRVVPQNDYDLLMVLGGALAAFIVFHFLGSLIRAHLLLRVRTLVDARMTLGFIEHLAALPYAFFQQRSAGDLMMRLNSNANVREIITAGVFSALLDGGFVTLYLLILFAISAPIAIVALTLATLQVAIVLLTWRRQKEFMSANLQTQAVAQSYQFEMLTGMETLKAMGVEQTAVDRWSDLFVDVLNVSIARGQLGAMIEAATSALRLGSPLLILGFGGLKVLNGDLTLGTMLAVSAVAEGFLSPLGTLVTTAGQFQLLGSYIERLDDVLDASPEQDGSKARPADRLRGQVRLERVCFRYGKVGPLALRDVSLDIQPGQHVAIVGRSGAGKSTLARLMVGLYAPESGRLLYDGTDLAELDLRSVRRQFGVMMQQPYLFGGSVRSNIALGNPSMAMDAVIEAATLAHIHDDIVRMPLGYDSLLASGGASLSGGQRQRLALARVLARKPSILVLDEATNALDAVTEAQVHDELRALRCTTVVVAHRLSTVAAADLILVLDNGALVEQGTHRELLAKGGVYATLVDGDMELLQTVGRQTALRPPLRMVRPLSAPRQQPEYNGRVTVPGRISPADMPRTDTTIELDSNAPPFDQFKGLQLLARNRRGHVSVEHARHQLYVGSDKQSHANVLIKVTSRPGLTYQDNLQNEIASLLTINGSLPESPYFPVIREHGKLRDGRVFLIASFFHEFPLATAIGKERIPSKTVAYIQTAREIARALAELHGLKIYHVDLNPMNILLRLEHGRPIIRIIDFESSYEWRRHSTGAFYNPPNTPGYSAPEISRQAPDARADVFSLGAVLYTMLAGYKWTWEGDVWICVEGDADIDPDLKGILAKAVDPKPDNRYSSIGDLDANLAVHLERIWPGREVVGSWGSGERDES